MEPLLSVPPTFDSPHSLLDAADRSGRIPCCRQRFQTAWNAHDAAANADPRSSSKGNSFRMRLPLVERCCRWLGYRLVIEMDDAIYLDSVAMNWKMPGFRMATGVIGKRSS